MKFGKGLQTQIEETLPEWRDKFLAYKPLKKRLKQISAPEFFTEVGFYALNLPLDGYCTSVAQKVSENLDAAGTTKQPVVEETIAGVGDDLTHRPRGVSERKHGGCGTGISEKDNFVNLLNDELEKFNDFFIDKEEEYVIRIQEEGDIGPRKSILHF